MRSISSLRACASITAPLAAALNAARGVLSIGSMNMDRRSARSNTESTIVIDDPVLAGEVTAFFERGRVPASYALRLDEAGKRVEWVGGEARGVLRTEPRRPGGSGIKPRLASFFVSEDLL